MINKNTFIKIAVPLILLGSILLIEGCSNVGFKNSAIEAKLTISENVASQAKEQDNSFVVKKNTEVKPSLLQNIDLTKRDFNLIDSPDSKNLWYVENNKIFQFNLETNTASIFLDDVYQKYIYEFNCSGDKLIYRKNDEVYVKYLSVNKETNIIALIKDPINLPKAFFKFLDEEGDYVGIYEDKGDYMHILNLKTQQIDKIALKKEDTPYNASLDYFYGNNKINSKEYRFPEVYLEENDKSEPIVYIKEHLYGFYRITALNLASHSSEVIIDTLNNKNDKSINLIFDIIKINKGKSLIFSGRNNDEPGIFTYDINSGNIIKIISGGKDEHGPWFPLYKLSPDKTQILYNTPRNDDKISFYLAKLEGSNITSRKFLFEKSLDNSIFFDYYWSDEGSDFRCIQGFYNDKNKSSLSVTTSSFSIYSK